MPQLPFYLSLLIITATFLTVWIFFLASRRSRMTLIVILGWLGLQTAISITGFYTNTESLPPRLLLLVIPPLLLILLLFITRKGLAYLDRLELKWLTLLHMVRVPVEIVLLLLFMYKTVPELMTFEGRNFDIISGLTAPVVYYFYFVRKQIGRKVLLAWNFICLGLLLNILITAILSAPFPFQQLAFEQPNIAVFYFPFVFLPGCIVPLVLLSHLAAIRQLVR